MLQVIDLSLSILQGIFGKLKNQVPEAVTQAVQAAIDALAAHHNDLLTKANFDAQRG